MDDVEMLRQLVDIEAIKQLKARYFRLMDQKRWDEWAMVFAHDAHLVVPEGGGRRTGRVGVVASVSGVLEGVRTVHHGHMPEIEITGPDTARGTWAMFDYVEFPSGPAASASGCRATATTPRSTCAKTATGASPACTSRGFASTPSPVACRACTSGSTPGREPRPRPTGAPAGDQPAVRRAG